MSYKSSGEIPPLSGISSLTYHAFIEQGKNNFFSHLFSFDFGAENKVSTVENFLLSNFLCSHTPHFGHIL